MSKKRPPAPCHDAADPWSRMRQFTAARIGLPRAGASLATPPLLEFRLAHARARDAVREMLDEARLAEELKPLGLPLLPLASAVKDRMQYLMRPDLGRALDEASVETLRKQARESYDIAFVVTDGLSARAVQSHATPLLAQVVSVLRKENWRLAPLSIVRQGRVAIGDAVASGLGAPSAAVLIGERPGLSSPDSLGVYLTWAPGPASTDADRNCISNIRPDGMPAEEAAFKLLHLIRAMRARKISGVALKDDSDRARLGSSLDPHQVPGGKPT
ncbi:MAG TPA: ethanolamine ammonia-lyase subunit EutC [Pseudolabrys sp.]|nr:ethanolamine ammonia-lyase subunit EutC [Pseudolabrys sp.]